MSKVLITGCSTGIGFSIAKVASERGHTVVATMRSPTGRNADNAARLRAECEGYPGPVHVVELDVASDESVAEGSARALELVGELDAVVHNAGIGSLGLIETFTTEQIRDVFEVNVFGAHRLNRALLPHMRSRGSGLVVFVSSAIGRILFPYFGAYGPSKFAIEAMGECYHNELRPFGVDVTIVQAGGFVTQFFANAQTPGDAERVESYGEIGQLASKFYTSGAGFEMPGPDVLAVGIADLIDAEPGTRPLRKVIDPMTGAALEGINEAIATIQGQVFAAMAAAAGEGAGGS